MFLRKGAVALLQRRPDRQKAGNPDLRFSLHLPSGFPVFRPSDPPAIAHRYI
jgi:hypothetical protein